MIIGTLAACINGTTVPLTALFASRFYINFTNSNKNELVEVCGRIMLNIGYIGITSFLSSWIMICTWILIG